MMPIKNEHNGLISFAIVNWNGGEVFEKCIESIHNNCILENFNNYEIVIVDNASSNFNKEYFNQFKNIKFIFNSHNYGFSVATNQSIANANGEFLFILNNDVIFFDNTLKCVLNEIHQLKNHHAIVPALFYPDEKIQRSVLGLPLVKDVIYACIGLNFISPKFDHWFNIDFDYTQAHILTNQQPMFSALLVTRKTWNKVGPLDENFPILWNDVDWFKRFYNNNFTGLFIPEIKLYHIHGYSVNKNRFKKIWRSTKGMYRYFYKHHQYNTFQLMGLKLFCGIQYLERLIFEIFKMIIK